MSESRRLTTLGAMSSGQKWYYEEWGELAGPFDISLPAVSRHLKVLESAHLIEREKDAQFRRCRLNAGPLRDAADWISRYKEFWEDDLGALADYLNEMKEVDRGGKAKTGKDSKQD